jgi:hypothetical protein
VEQYSAQKEKEQSTQTLLTGATQENKNQARYVPGTKRPCLVILSHEQANSPMPKGLSIESAQEKQDVGAYVKGRLEHPLCTWKANPTDTKQLTKSWQHVPTVIPCSHGIVIATKATYESGTTLGPLSLHQNCTKTELTSSKTRVSFRFRFSNKYL